MDLVDKNGIVSPLAEGKCCKSLWESSGLSWKVVGQLINSSGQAGIPSVCSSVECGMLLSVLCWTLDWWISVFRWASLCVLRGRSGVDKGPAAFHKENDQNNPPPPHTKPEEESQSEELQQHRGVLFQKQQMTHPVPNNFLFFNIVIHGVVVFCSRRALSYCNVTAEQL